MSSETVTGLLADLGAERATTWDPAVLEAGAAARAHAIESAATHPAARPGDAVAPFELTEVDDGALTLADVTADGPVVLLFFRFAGCGVCNLTLPHYGRVLAPELAALGVPLVAISPQPVDELVEIKRAHDLPFRVAYDADNALARSLGLTFTPKEPMGPPGGTSFAELPHPSFVLVDGDGVVRWLSVTPDWMAWTESADVLAAVRQLVATA
jgi:peroxiredoxin